jgi:hypothetical protein
MRTFKSFTSSPARNAAARLQRQALDLIPDLVALLDQAATSHTQFADVLQLAATGELTAEDRARVLELSAIARTRATHFTAVVDKARKTLL